MEICNTQNKTYNHIRRTYIDEGDLKEGQLICPKCDGGGSYPKKSAALEDPYFLRCSKCQGIGIVDWIENVVGKPAIMSGRSSSSFSSADPNGQVSLYYKGTKLLETNSKGMKIFTPKAVTNYKRRKIV